MRYFHVVIAILLTVGISSCSVSKKTTQELPFKTTASGIKYKIYQNEKAGTTHPNEGDYVEIFIKTMFEDSLIFDSKKETNGKPVAFPIKKPAFNGDLTEAILMMTKGDSGTFMVPVDTLKANKQNIQPWMEEGKSIAYTIKLENITTLEEIRKKQADEAGRQPKVDDSLLHAYFKEHKIMPQKTESGLYFLIVKESDGNKAIPGQKVTVNYTGKLLDGTVFDSNQDPQFNHVEPFQFVLGRGQVIQGWDEGIAKLKKGEKATLFIPSHMAYGQSSPSPAIPPNSVLIFDVELLP
ncbi:MAG: FKBP-type peptidyl-prolyl cis-trans isomerase [Chitinophagales bacterium]|nr:FKBP-type peptidyl-prolyl cis-trans isomerase [Chitinophagaceae bacterium]MCB9065600.1 FKBP-type peptidyl-prolyl cis-trans isomerase [Chitinophagales bacterium]